MLRKPSPYRYKALWVSIIAHISLLIALALALAPVHKGKMVLSIRLDHPSRDVTLLRIEKENLLPQKTQEFRDTKVEVDLSTLDKELEVPQVLSKSVFPEAVAWSMKLPISPSRPLTSQKPATRAQLGTHPGSQPSSGTGETSGRKAYFGIPISSRKVVFVADASSSMQGVLGLTQTDEKLKEAQRLGLNGKAKKRFMQNPIALGYPSRWKKLTEELSATVKSLHPTAEFSIVFFGDHVTALDEGLQHASSDNKRHAIHWVKTYRTEGGTKPYPALEKALSMRPGEIFVLTDGEFDPVEVHRITELNSRRNKETRIHAISMGSAKSTDVLQDLAHGNGGNFVFVRR